jgi:hypothetical protein
MFMNTNEITSNTSLEEGVSEENTRPHQADEVEARMTTMMLNSMGVCSVKTESEETPTQVNMENPLSGGE